MHGGKVIVEIFKRSGVDHVFSSPGTEWPPVWEAFAEAKERNDTTIQYVNCRHEAAAVAMASGYRAATPAPLRPDLRDGGANPVDGGFTVGILVIAPRRVEVGDVRGAADKNNRRWEFQRPLAAVLRYLSYGAIGRDRNDGVALVDGNPEFTVSIKIKPVRSF